MARIDDSLVSRWIFYPRKERPETRSAGIATRTPVSGAEIGGYLHADATTDGLVLFFHGNGEIAADYDDIAGFIKACGVALWVVDYRGYGRSTGAPSFGRMLEDAESVYRDIPRLSDVAGRAFERVFVMGRSLGSASAILLAAAHDGELNGLVLDSPFADGPALIHRIGGPKLDKKDLPGSEDNLDRMARCTLPCRIIHGTRDAIIPVDEARALHAACPAADKRLVEISGAGHNDLMAVGFSRYFGELRSFFA